MAKQFDVVVFGATGFTGAYITRYLLQSPEAGLSWAIAGRSASKLEQAKQQLKEKLPGVDAASIDAVPTLIADSSSEAQLVELVKKTKVVITVVGPYKLYGELLVKACAQNGVHYCDLTAETFWIDEMITKYEAAAAKSGAIIVHCCGFEAVPSDLTALLLTEKVRETRNSATSEVSVAILALEGGPSGGTVASLFTMLETATPEEMKNSSNPFYLTDEKTRVQKEASGATAKNAGSLLVKKDKDLGVWTSFFIGAPVNQAVVHRSNYLKKDAYGSNFVYRERMSGGGLFAQIIGTMFVVIGGVLLYFSWTRSILKKFVPQPGEGPSEEVVANSKFLAKAVAYDENGKLAARATIGGAGHPGYAITSKLISQCAICLAKGETVKDIKGGFHTPASALGRNLVKRLDDKKIVTFDVQAVETN